MKMIRIERSSHKATLININHIKSIDVESIEGTTFLKISLQIADMDSIEISTIVSDFGRFIHWLTDRLVVDDNIFNFNPDVPTCE